MPLRSHCAAAYGSKELFLFVHYPAFIPHPGGPGLGNMPGYFLSSLAGLEHFLGYKTTRLRP
jgi:hypothetical protein